VLNFREAKKEFQVMSWYEQSLKKLPRRPFSWQASMEWQAMNCASRLTGDCWRNSMQRRQTGPSQLLFTESTFCEVFLSPWRRHWSLLSSSRPEWYRVNSQTQGGGENGTIRWCSLHRRYCL